MTNHFPERRRRGRVPVCLAVTVCLEGEEIAVTSRDISLKGLACSPHPLLRANACCQVVISLTPDIQSTMRGRVVRAGETGAAIDFFAMDPESFAHLKKIVEYHSRCPEEVARELLTPAFSISRPPTPFASRKDRK